MICRGVVFTLLILSCHAQLPSLTTFFVNLFPRNPIIQSAAKTAGEAVANTVGVITKFPTAMANALGGTVPDLTNLTNVADLTDNVLAEFTLGQDNEDAYLNIEQLIKKYGYPVESHDVETEDGYFLTMFRIPSSGPVVFLMHGILGSADDFVIAGAGSGLAYLLADEGYDVWMGNARGNKHSRRHARLDPSESIYWDFTWHEIGYYDLPSMIDYVLDTTNSTKLKYVGHSQGTTVFFVMASERKDYNDKIAVMVALSPVAFMGNAKSPVVRLLAPGGPLIYLISTTLGIYEVLPDNAFTRILKRVTCGTDVLAEILCSNTAFLLAGFDYEQLNVTNIPVLLGHMPCGASTKQFLHYGQGVVSTEFRQFDYGVSENLIHYGTTKPPKYKLNDVTARVSLFYSDSDWLAHPKDVHRLYDELPNGDLYKVPYEEFNHLDFLFAKDFKTLIYKKLHKLLSLF